MRKTMLFLFLFLLGLSSDLTAFNLFTNYSKQPPEQNVQDLTVDQINNPTNPYTNYNLGVALYKTEKFDQAKNNFQRTILHAKNNTLKEHSLVNLGNSCYKYALSYLPSNWQDNKTEIDQSKIMTAIQQIQESIKSYENALEINKLEDHAKTNLVKAKDTLKKLQEKLKQQQQNKDQDKDQNQDKNQQENKDKSKQDQQQNQEQKSSDSGKEGKDHQDKQQNPTQNNQDSPDKSGNNRADRKQEKSDQEKSQDEKQQDLKHNQNQSQQEQQKPEHDTQENRSQEQGTQQKEQNQEHAQQAASSAAQKEDAQESKEQKTMRAMLDNLQSYETNLQKAKVLQKTHDGQKALTSSQKPW